MKIFWDFFDVFKGYFLSVVNVGDVAVLMRKSDERRRQKVSDFIEVFVDKIEQSKWRPVAYRLQFLLVTLVLSW